MIVEDEPDIADSLSILLELEGYETEAVGTAAAALAADLDRVSVVVSDLQLPDLDGRQLVRRIHSRRPVKAIALSGYGTESDIRASREAGFLVHLVKPVEIDALVAAIELALASERSRGKRPALAPVPRHQ